MFAQARDASLKTITKVELARQRFVLVARHIPNNLAAPFHTNRICIVDVTRFTYQSQ